MREGFGSFFEATFENGICVLVSARKLEDGTPKVLKPQMLIGYLLEMSVGSKSTPKGGHAADLAARAAMEVATACGLRSKMKCAATATLRRRVGRGRDAGGQVQARMAMGAAAMAVCVAWS